ncbi:MAG TPA: hypothetical protein VL463_18085 [Kofleriaceae bacterium]|nr:hypothetical protein [Kofleriaceae bacterium]
MGSDRRALAASLLEREVRPKPPPEEMTPPIAWLLGPEMIGALKSFLLHASYKGELDTHDWMQANAIAYEPPAGEDVFWFDFVSDIGDGQRAMYTTALVMQDDLFVERLEAGAMCALPANGARPDGWHTLPRGRVLVCGGDTAYPLADRTNLEHHVRAPFTWAYRDLVAAGRLTDDEGRALAPHDFVGIPGNHDYYNELSGFNRMFRAPITGEEQLAADKTPPLSLLGFQRRQTASYLALTLPFGWQLWGMDPGDRGLDTRQELFFRTQPAPNKLVLVTPGPPIAFGRVLIDRPLASSLARLGLPLPYASDPMLDGKPPDPSWPRELANGTCRLDIAGDMHHYARYGSEPEYKAVVSGAGGAFHHPTYTDFGEVRTEAVYPAKAESRRAVADALFNPRTIFNGGVVNVASFAVALVVCAGSIRRDTRVLTDWLLGWLGVDGERTWFTDAPARAWRTTHWSTLEGAALFAGSIVIAGIFVLGALGYARWVTRTIRKPKEEWPWIFRAIRALPIDRILDERGYVPSWLLVIAAATLPALTGQLVELPPGGALLFQILFLSVVATIVALMLIMALEMGGEEYRPVERTRWWVLGAIHAAIQLSTPLIIVRVGLGHPISLAFALAVMIGAGFVSRLVLVRGGPLAPTVLMVLWIAHWVLMIAIIVDAGDGVAVVPASDAGWVAFLFLAGAVGSIVGCLEYGWYLAVSSAQNGHNNEAGAASRIERFREFIRFRVEQDRLTGYVIAIDEPATEPGSIKPRVVDVFTISPR